MVDGHHAEEEKKGQRVNSLQIEDDLMSRLEKEEKKTMRVATEDYYMPMTTCEDGVDTSYLKVEKGAMLSEAIGCTDVGQLRDRLDMQLNQCLLAELVESPGVLAPAGMILQGMPALGRIWMIPFLIMGVRWTSCLMPKEIIGITNRPLQLGQE